MKKIDIKLKFFIFSLAIFSLPVLALSQSVDSYRDSLRFILTPVNPQPNQNITVRLESSLIDLSVSNIIWSVNGKEVVRGKDRRVLETKVSNAGKETIVSAAVESNSYGLVEKDLIINPTSINLVYEANTYTPPFYKGKALPSPESAVTLLALPNFIKTNGQAILSKDLVFTWKKDGVVDGANSGLGKNTYSFLTGRLSENTPLIELNVLYPEENIRGFASFLIANNEPQLIIYENNPILGVRLNKMISREGVLPGKEMGLISYPYYFSGKNRESGNFEYSWYINNEKIIDIPKNQSTLTIRSPGGEGSSSLRVSLSNLSKIFQFSSANILINYSE